MIIELGKISVETKGMDQGTINDPGYPTLKPRPLYRFQQ